LHFLNEKHFVLVYPALFDYLP